VPPGRVDNQSVGSFTIIGPQVLRKDGYSRTRGNAPQAGSIGENFPTGTSVADRTVAGLIVTDPDPSHQRG